MGRALNGESFRSCRVRRRSTRTSAARHALDFSVMATAESPRLPQGLRGGQRHNAALRACARAMRRGCRPQCPGADWLRGAMGRRRRPSADRGGRRAGAARGRQRGRRGARGDADVVRGRAAADRARRRRLHARGRRRGASRRCSTSSSQAPGVRGGRAGRARRRARRRRRLLRRRRRRSSTSARPRAAPTACRPGSARRSQRFGHACRSPSSPRPAARARARGRAAQRRAGLRGRDPRADLLTSTPECAALCAPDGPRAARGRACSATPSSATRSSGSGREGARAVLRGRHRRGRVATGSPSAAGCSTREDLAAYEVVPREPVRVAYRGREVLTNPPPSAGGTLIAYALGAARARARRRRALRGVVAAMDAAQAERTPAVPRRARRARASSSASSPRRLGSTTHISVLDAARRRVQRDVHQRRGLGRRRARHRHPPQQHDGRAGPQPARLPPPPARAADAEHDGADRRAARRRGRAGARQRRAPTASARRSCRRSSASSTTASTRAPRSTRRGCTSRTASSTPSRASTLDEASRRAEAMRVVRFRAPNLFFGGVQAVRRPRRRA